jgi:hypothetical protein
MIPQLDRDGYLPEGIHEAKLEEIERRFAIFTTSDRRIQLFARLKELVGEAERSGIVARIVLGGSFVSGKAEPEDVDCILILKAGTADQPELPPAQYALVSLKRVRKRFKADIFSLEEGSAKLNQVLDVFQRRKENPHQRRGIVEVLLSFTEPKKDAVHIDNRDGF